RGERHQELAPTTPGGSGHGVVVPPPRLAVRLADMERHSRPLTGPSDAPVRRAGYWAAVKVNWSSSTDQPWSPALRPVTQTRMCWVGWVIRTGIGVSPAARAARPTGAASSRSGFSDGAVLISTVAPPLGEATVALLSSTG